MSQHPPLLFACTENREFASRIGRYLDIPLAEHIEQDFEDGEYKIRSAVSVRNREVYVVQSLYGDHRYSIHDKLIRLLFFIGALKDAAAEKVTTVVQLY